MTKQAPVTSAFLVLTETVKTLEKYARKGNDNPLTAAFNKLDTHHDLDTIGHKIGGGLYAVQSQKAGGKDAPVLIVAYLDTTQKQPVVLDVSTRGHVAGYAMHLPSGNGKSLDAKLKKLREHAQKNPQNPEGTTLFSPKLGKVFD